MTGQEGFVADTKPLILRSVRLASDAYEIEEVQSCTGYSLSGGRELVSLNLTTNEDNSFSANFFDPIYREAIVEDCIVTK